MDFTTLLHRYVLPPPKSGIEIQVINWNNGQPLEVAVSLLDFDQMITLSPAAARDFAFHLMQCADKIDPPFADMEDEKV